VTIEGHGKYPATKNVIISNIFMQHCKCFSNLLWLPGEKSKVKNKFKHKLSSPVFIDSVQILYYNVKEIKFSNKK